MGYLIVHIALVVVLLFPVIALVVMETLEMTISPNRMIFALFVWAALLAPVLWAFRGLAIYG
jgi:hypothetical protein